MWTCHTCISFVLTSSDSNSAHFFSSGGNVGTRFLASVTLFNVLNLRITFGKVVNAQSDKFNSVFPFFLQVKIRSLACCERLEPMDSSARGGTTKRLQLENDTPKMGSRRAILPNKVRINILKPSKAYSRSSSPNLWFDLATLRTCIVLLFYAFIIVVFYLPPSPSMSNFFKLKHVLNKDKIKTSFEITVKKVTHLEEYNGKPVSLSWKRGKRPANAGSLKDAIVNNGEAVWDEKITVQVTLFKEVGVDKFDEKSLHVHLSQVRYSYNTTTTPHSRTIQQLHIRLLAPHTTRMMRTHRTCYAPRVARNPTRVAALRTHHTTMHAPTTPSSNTNTKPCLGTQSNWEIAD